MSKALRELKLFEQTDLCDFFASLLTEKSMQPRRRLRLKEQNEESEGAALRQSINNREHESTKCA